MCPNTISNKRNILLLQRLFVILWLGSLAVCGELVGQGVGTPIDSLTHDRSSKIFQEDSLSTSPTGAIVRSALLPGWGQLYNKRYKKTFLFLAADLSMIGMYLYKNDAVRDVRSKREQVKRQRDSDPFIFPEKKQTLDVAYNFFTGELDDALSDRNQYGWYFALSIILLTLSRL